MQPKLNHFTKHSYSTKTLIYFTYPKDNMQRFKNIVQTIHRKIRTNNKIQLIIYLCIVAIFLSIGILITVNMTDNFSYEIKKCYNRQKSYEESPTIISIAPKGDKIIILYDFNQKCFSKMRIDYMIQENNIKVFFKPENMKEDCFCDTDFKAEIGPLEPGEYKVSLIKKPDSESYVVNEETVQIE